MKRRCQKIICFLTGKDIKSLKIIKTKINKVGYITSKVLGTLKQKIAACWLTFKVVARWEVEAGGSLVARNLRLY